MTTSPWIASTTVVGTPTARCMMLAPLRRPPRNSAATATSSGLPSAKSATTIPSKP